MDSMIFSLIAHIMADLLCFKDDKQGGVYFEPIQWICPGVRTIYHIYLLLL